MAIGGLVVTALAQAGIATVATAVWTLTACLLLAGVAYGLVSPSSNLAVVAEAVWPTARAETLFGARAPVASS